MTGIQHIRAIGKSKFSSASYHVSTDISAVSSRYFSRRLPAEGGGRSIELKKRVKAKVLMKKAQEPASGQVTKAVAKYRQRRPVHCCISDLYISAATLFVVIGRLNVVDDAPNLDAEDVFESSGFATGNKNPVCVMTRAL